MEHKKEFKFSSKSTDILKECDLDLIALLTIALKDSPLDMSVLCGYRNKEDQNKEYAEGDSQVLFPHSKHNKHPSRAVDIAPYPIDFDDIDSFKKIAKHILKTAKKLNIKIRWLGFIGDYGHFELV